MNTNNEEVIDTICKQYSSIPFINKTCAQVCQIDKVKYSIDYCRGVYNWTSKPQSPDQGYGSNPCRYDPMTGTYSKCDYGASGWAS